MFDYRDFIRVLHGTAVSQEHPIEYAASKINSTVKNLREGLDPDVLAYWFKRIEDKSRETVPEHLKDKVHFEQDRILWMKFKMDVSKRAVPTVMQVIEEYIPMMPYSTGLYFRKIQEILTEEMNKDLR
ncbi:MAG TPA: hypothetical protein VHA09_03120 [Nitrososphaera sp.]|nr:hypothetical protein [Nitrososphaera sp.]